MFDYLGIDKGIQDQKLLPIGGRRNEYIESNSSPELNVSHSLPGMGGNMAQKTEYRVKVPNL
jgi:hypothetical protein